MIQVVAAQAVHRAALEAHHAAVRVTTGFTKRNVALLFEADTLLMKLTAEFLSLFGVESSANSLLIPKGGKHIRSRHRHDTAEILSGLLPALTNIKYVQERRNRTGKMEYGVIGEHRPGRMLFVAIKFVPARSAASGEDEALVPTAYIINLREVDRLLYQGQLRQVFPVRLS